MIMIGDSKDPDGPTLTHTRAEFAELITRIRRGDFDQF
jgi:hypothetical protein